MSIGEKIIIVLVFLPFIFMLFYTYQYPRESALWGQRWRYKNEDLEPSEAAIGLNKKSSLIGMIVITIILLLIVIFA